MKGVIDKIWKNKTDDGKPYFVLKILSLFPFVTWHRFLSLNREARDARFLRMMASSVNPTARPETTGLDAREAQFF